MFFLKQPNDNWDFLRPLAGGLVREYRCNTFLLFTVGEGHKDSERQHHEAIQENVDEWQLTDDLGEMD